MKTPTLTKNQMKALKLLARGGARYGTQIMGMKELHKMGLCYAHDKGQHLKKGRWTWRPTKEGWSVINELGVLNGGGS